jgi:hypothetical protein
MLDYVLFLLNYLEMTELYLPSIIKKIANIEFGFVYL